MEASLNYAVTAASRLILDAFNKGGYKTLLILLLLLATFKSDAQQLYKIISVNERSSMITLENQATKSMIDLSIDNFTIGDYEILKSISYTISELDSLNADTLKIQALRNGAGWISNVNKASKAEIHGLLQGLTEKVGIWVPGYMRQHAKDRTYKVLNAYFKNIGFSITDNEAIDSNTSKDSATELVDDLNSQKNNYTILLQEIAVLKEQHYKDSIEKLNIIAKHSIALRNEKKRLDETAHSKIDSAAEALWAKRTGDEKEK